MKATILAYHAIAECPRDCDPDHLFVSPDRFERQMDFLARRRTVVSLDEALGAGTACVAITFDDAYRSVATTALPILEAHGFPATVFAPTGHLGGGNTWDEGTSCDLSIMDESELSGVSERGVAVESHGHDHLDYSAETTDRLRSDVGHSLDDLERITGRRPRYLAYPYGRSSASARRVVAELGLSAAFSIDKRGNGPFERERVPITPLDSDPLFSFKTSGRYLAVRWSPPVAAVYRVVKPLARRAMLRKDA